MGGLIIWPLANHDQLQVLSNVPKLTSLLSILGSCYIIFDICRLEKRNTYHRIIFGMNVMDLMALVAWFFTTWPMPEGTEGVVSAKGNQGTCSAQGFFSQLSIATVLYNACLAIYFMLVIKWGWTEQRIQKARLEYIVHAVCITVGVGTAVLPLMFRLYNPSAWQCWIAAAPTGCTESGEIKSKDDNGIGFLQGASNHSTSFSQSNSTTAELSFEAPFPCTRGDNANLFQYVLFFLPLWTCIVVATFCLYQVYSAFKKQDQVTAKWKQKLMYATAKPSKILRKTTKATTRVASRATSKTFKYTSKSVRSLITKSSKPRPPAGKKQKYTPAQKRKIEREGGRFSGYKNDGISEQQIAGCENEQSNRGDSTKSVDGLILDSSNQSNASRKCKAPMKRLPPLLGTNQLSKEIEALPRSETNVDEVSHGNMGAIKKTRKVHSAKSKLVTSQALLYLVSFYAAWLFPTVTRIQESVTKDGVAYYHLVLLTAFFVPLQGLMNFVVYIRPKVITIRREKRRLAALKKKQEESETRVIGANKPSTMGTMNGGLGSTIATSSRLMTITTVSNDERPIKSHNEIRDKEDYDWKLHCEAVSVNRDNKDGLAPPLNFPEESLHRNNEDGPSEPRKADTNSLNTDHVLHEEESIGRDDAIEDLFGALNSSSHHGRQDARTSTLRSHSSTSNLLHVQQREEEKKTSKLLMDLFNRSVCLDSQGHVLTSNSFTPNASDDNLCLRIEGKSLQKTNRSNHDQVSESGLSTLESTISGGDRRVPLSRKNMLGSSSDDVGKVSEAFVPSLDSDSMKRETLGTGSFSNKRTDVLPGDSEPRLSSGSSIWLKSDDCILDSGLDSELFRHTSNDFASYHSLPPKNEPNAELSVFRGRPSNVHALSQPSIIVGRKDRTIRRTKTDIEQSENGSNTSNESCREKQNDHDNKNGSVSFHETAKEEIKLSRSSKKKLSKRQLLFQAKDTWVSKKGAQLVKGGIKGGLGGFKSIRSFAVDLKDALKADSAGDWVNAINDEEERPDDEDGVPVTDTEDERARRQVAPQPYHGEEEKEEIGVIVEEQIELCFASDVIEEQASLPSIA